MAKVYITTAIPYVNSDPHIGHTLEFVQADCYARYRRLKGDEVFFVSGTDENSLKNALVAEQQGIAVKELVDRYSSRFEGLKKVLNLSFDDFIRTTQLRHVEGAQKFWQSCSADIYAGFYEGLYCVGCEDFFKESDLVNGLCPDHKKPPEKISEKNYFFKLSNYQEFLEKIYKNEEIKVFPENRKGEVINFLKEGARDFSVSRSRQRSRNWGIAVPEDQEQMIYVWFDALTNYITVLGYAKNAPMFRAWWEDPSSEICHFIGKNITKFHCLYWPAMLASANLRLPTNIVVHGFITLEGEKISKSLGNVIDPFEIAEEFGTDALRFYLLRDFSLAQDGDFSRSGLIERYNSELANGLGNLASRSLALIEKEGGKINPKASLLNPEIQEAKKKYFEAFKEFKFQQAVESFLRLASQTDAFINEKQVWKETDVKKREEIFSSLWLVLAELAIMIEPFIPFSSFKLKEALGLEKNENGLAGFSGEFFVKRPEPIFPRRI